MIGLQPLAVELLSSVVEHFKDDFIIEPLTVEKKLSKINFRKSCGPDNIPNLVLRDNSVCLAEPVFAIFNMSSREGIFPTV